MLFGFAFLSRAKWMDEVLGGIGLYLCWCSGDMAGLGSKRCFPSF